MTGRRLDVDASFRLPDLARHLPEDGRVLTRAPEVTHTSGYDTPDGRLAAAGVSLAHRPQRPEPWTVTLPIPGRRGRAASREVSAPDDPPDDAPDNAPDDAPGPPRPPASLVALVTAFTRGAPIVVSTRSETTRTRIELRDRDDALLAEVADERVAVEDARGQRSGSRAVTVTAHHATPKRVDRLITALRAHGAVLAPPGAPGAAPAPPRAKDAAHTDRRAKDAGLAGLRAKDAAHTGRRAKFTGLAPVSPSSSKPGRRRARPVVAAALRRDVAEIVGFDPLTRLRATLPDGDTALHRMRAGVRRLWADLATFTPLLADAWVRPLRGELAWLGDALGAARDAEVLRARLRRTAGGDPLAPLDPIAIARIDADLAARAEDARVAVDAVLASGRYRALLGTLHAVAADPPLRPGHPGDPRKPVARAWRRLDARADLDPMTGDDAWHAARIRTRRTRYAVESLDPRAELAAALAAAADLLGAHSDAVAAGRTWLEIAASDPDDHVLAVTAGRLHERERGVVTDVRAAYPPLWRAIRRAKLAEWLT